ncbi:ATP synthase F1 mitochondrial assembly chaperone ATP12 [Acetobacter nitrogenifigens DSM 23921 = NBRC 105050]|uniref:ATPase n=1 Tax=Acetobacter nitrogenifigens DSM 23921 = NBRC 105050 TaxID=1120919 RepID=A0A511XDP4_9PROT|nr:ATP12 family protein [Acetobacter nitrogenifigens]GBQ97344.1 ATP synthase F1 mitochondrial assembly chaperone ATP12 [Acetobacter nitrogenifigens DSM 23921 = NBRC 105050]GEN61021.1 ATPase [Acetobacter nitrogenifigens DSM 23921 = NBRC 105050]
MNSRPVPGSSSGLKKRFWTEASVTEDMGEFGVALDGRPVRLPGGTPLRVSSRALAEALAEEWSRAGRDDVERRFGPLDLPLTRITGTMIERVAPDRLHSIRTLMEYGKNDALCYWTDEGGALAERQEAELGPWLTWSATRLGADLIKTTGLMPVTQPPEALGRLEATLIATSDADLAGLGVAVPALGSLVLGLALMEGALSVDEAVSLTTLDEQVQMARWGEDSALLDRIATIAADLSDAVRFMTLAR